MDEDDWHATTAIDDRPSCPVCGTARPNELFFGLMPMPTESDLAAWRQLGLAPGGCVDEGARWHCAACEHEWGDDLIGYSNQLGG